jgi:hypothetical protein
LSLEEPSGFPVPKAPNHVDIVTPRVIRRKGLWRGLTDLRINCRARPPDSTRRTPEQRCRR